MSRKIYVSKNLHLKKSPGKPLQSKSFLDYQKERENDRKKNEKVKLRTQ